MANDERKIVNPKQLTAEEELAREIVKQEGITPAAALEKVRAMKAKEAAQLQDEHGSADLLHPVDNESAALPPEQAEPGDPESEGAS